jgi:glycosyltransferase involved in cell wall biosynthesis
MEILMTSIIDLKKSQHNRPHEFLKYLSKKHNITVLSINDYWKGKQDNHKEYSADFDDIFENINYHYITNRKIAPILQEMSFTKQLSKISKINFDIHYNYNTLISGYKFSNHIKTVFDLADDLPAMIRNSPQIPKPLRFFGGLLGDIYLKKNINSSEYVTLTTESLETTCNIPFDKIKIIPNGVNTDNFKPYKNMKEEFGINGFIIGYVGVLREWVNLEPIFKILGQLNKEVKLLVVGKEGRYRENVELAEKHGVADRVIFTGTISYSQVPKYISAMDICLIPFALNDISQNALPLKLFEYMACEKPVISTPIPAVKKIAGCNVLYATNEVEYLEKINLLYEDKNLRNKLGKQGRKISEEYSWEKIALELDQLLETVAYGETNENVLPLLIPEKMKI